MPRSIYGRRDGRARREQAPIGLWDRLTGWCSAGQRHPLLVILGLMLCMAAAIQLERWLAG